MSDRQAFFGSRVLVASYRVSPTSASLSDPDLRREDSSVAG